MAAALKQVDGTYGIAVVSAREPGKLVAARNGSPLLVGLGDEEYFVASDAAAVLQYTRSVVYLDDGEVAVISGKGYAITDLDTKGVQKRVRHGGLGPRYGRTWRIQAFHAQGDHGAAGQRPGTRSADGYSKMREAPD